jgi:hypothetical protein
MAVTLLVAVSNTETVPLPELGIYAYGPVTKGSCAVVTEAVDTMKNKHKVIVAKAIEGDFVLGFIKVLLISDFQKKFKINTV